MGVVINDTLEKLVGPNRMRMDMTMGTAMVQIALITGFTSFDSSDEIQFALSRVKRRRLIKRSN